ncbi:hypothetical protein [Microbacterium aerolatum]|uniref:hypothetical protein n=1 Tax=Microbacterium aerolatum TaxID=153731 RepID=UPI00384A47F6
MAEYKHIANIKGERGDHGLKGDTGVLANLDVELLPWGEQPYAEMTGPESHRGAIVHIPMPMPGPETVNNDDATELLVKNPTKTRAAMLEEFVAQADAVETFSAMDRVGSLTKTPDVFAYSASSTSVQRLEIPSHLNGPDQFQATHPSVKFFPKGWNGWRYWMAFTPYPGGNAAHEDPCIAVSQDGKTWYTFPGFTNPLDDGPDASHYNADTELAISPDGSTLYCMWRYTDTTTKVVEFRVRSTTDGLNWSPYVVAMTHADYTVENYVSPTLAHDGTQWVMWGVNVAANPNSLVRLTAPEITGPWSSAVTCTASAEVGRDFWHVAVIRTADGYVALVNDTTANISGGNGDLYLMSSPDGLTWTRGWPLFQLPFGTEFTGQYRGTLVPTETGFDIWFGAHDITSTRWFIYRAQIKPDPALRTAASKWIDATVFKPGVAGAVDGVVSSFVNGWMLRADQQDSVGTREDLPGWRRFAVEVWFATTSAAAGTVKFNVNYRQFTDGGTIGAPPSVAGTAVAVPGVSGVTLKSTVITSVPIAADGPWFFRVQRDGAGDTYPDSVQFQGVRLVRRT